MSPFNCSYCNFSSPYKYNLRRHLKAVHHVTSSCVNDLEPEQPRGQQPIFNDIGYINELQHSTMPQLKQYEQSKKNLESDYIAKLNESLKCQQQNHLLVLFAYYRHLGNYHTLKLN